MTDLGFDLRRLEEELSRKVCRTAVGQSTTIIRKRAKALVRSSSGMGMIGMSRKTTTRGKYDSESGTMRSVGRGSWGPKTLRKRGHNKPSIGDAGGVIKKAPRFYNKICYGIVGAQYVNGSSGESGRTGHNHAHTHEPSGGAASGAPGHRAWGRKAKPLKPRPFLGPAAEFSMGAMEKAMYDALNKWNVDPSEWDFRE